MAEFTRTETITVDCPHCAAADVVRVGKRNGYQRYRCEGCGRKFRYNGMAPGHRVGSEQIGLAIRLFYSGMSYKQIGETMADAFDIPEPSKSNIYAWVKEYTDRATAAMQDYPAQVGDEWVADEMMVDVGGQKVWNWNVMDSKTRYVLASHLAKERNTKQAEIVIEKAIKAAAEPPKSLKTDKLGSYKAAIELAFPDIKHIQSQGIRAEINNNLSERLQGTYRQRVKTLRGLENLETGQRYLDGWTLTYNLFREHESLGYDTPGDRAKVNPPFTEWEDVVKYQGGELPSTPRRRSDLPEFKPEELIRRVKPTTEPLGRSPSRREPKPSGLKMETKVKVKKPSSKSNGRKWSPGGASRVPKIAPRKR